MDSGGGATSDRVLRPAAASPASFLCALHDSAIGSNAAAIAVSCAAHHSITQWVCGCRVGVEAARGDHRQWTEALLLKLNLQLGSGAWSSFASKG
jgi:hypothetical protein